MSTKELLNTIKAIAEQHKLVQLTSIGDIYELWNGAEMKYPAVNVALENVSVSIEEQTISNSIVIYYGDRLLQDKSNLVEVHNDAIRIIQSILNKIAGLDDVATYDKCVIRLWEQQFNDYLAGGYVSVTIDTTSDLGDCNLDDYIDEIRTLYITENGVYDIEGYDQVEVNVSGIIIEGITEEECREIVEGYNYATKDEIPSLDGYATENWVNEQGFLKEHQDLSEYAKTVDVNTALAKKQDNISDLDVIRSGAALGATAIQEHQSLEGYATEQWVNNQHFLTLHQDLSEYAKKSEIPSLDGYATESWVNEQGFLTEHQPLKTINGESIVGSGNITIEGGKQIYVIDATQDLGDGKTGFYLTREVIDHLNDTNNPVYMKVKFTYNNVEYTVLLEKKQNNEFITVNEETGKVSNNFPPFMTVWNRGANANNYFYLIEEKSFVLGKYVGDGISVSVTINTDNVFYSRKSLESYFPTTVIVSAAVTELRNKDAELEAKIPSLDGYATEEWVRSIFQYDEDTKTLNIII